MRFRSPCALIILLLAVPLYAADFAFSVLRYEGGGDWYEARVGVKNLMTEFNTRARLNAITEPIVVSASDPELFRAPLVFINGHGNIAFSARERLALRLYAEQGGFIFANDDYGMDASFRREIGFIFPDAELLELPLTHPIYSSFYTLTNGLPKIHEHDGGRPVGYGVVLKGRLVCYYAYNADIADGWADKEVHNVPDEKREEAIRMGLNVIVYSMHN